MKSKDSTDDVAHSAVALDERYVLIESIGNGASSTVFRARHKLLDQIVAVKVLRKGLLADESSVERFKREAKLCMRLEHPNIVKILDYGISLEDEPFIVMQFCEGQTLEHYLEQARLSSYSCRKIALQISSALNYAHDQSIVHRDIKPANIMLCRSADGEYVARLLDFGLAKDLIGATLHSPGQDQAVSGTSSGATAEQLTQTTFFLGTPSYMSPEQCRKEPADARSDLYSLGCVLYQCVTRSRPFEADSDMAIMNMQLYTVPTFRAHQKISADLKAIILKCLEKDPTKRFQNAAELSEALKMCSVLSSSSMRNIVPALMMAAALVLAPVVGLVKLYGPKSNPGREEDTKFAALLKQPRRSYDRMHHLGNNMDSTEDPKEILRRGERVLTGSPAAAADMKGAEELFEKAYRAAIIQKRPGIAAECLNALGRFHIRTNSLDLAEKNFRNAVDAVDSSPYSEYVQAVKVDGYLGLADLYHKRNNSKRRIEFYRKALAICPHDEMRILSVRRDLAYGLLDQKPLESKQLMQQNAADYSNFAGHDELPPQELWDESCLVMVELHLGELSTLPTHVDSLIARARKIKENDIARNYLDLCNELLNLKQYREALKLASAVQKLPAKISSIKEKEEAAQILQQASIHLESSRKNALPVKP